MFRRLMICCATLCLLAGPSFATPQLPWRPMALPAYEAPLADCVAALPGNLRVAFAQPAQRRRLRISRGALGAWQRCVALEHAWHDASAVQQLTHDLVHAWRAGARSAPSSGVTREAQRIAETLVHATRQHAGDAKMVGSPLFNNFLIKAGVKQEGFCYEWTKIMVAALQPFDQQFFELQWGTANIGNISENNGLLLSARGAPIRTGLVYDVWRAAGKPYWRQVPDDHYEWYVRLTEHQLRMGVADVLEGD